jgi:PmbA protein
VNAEELETIGDRITDRACGDEQIEAVLAWSRDAEVRVHQGEVEHYVDATSVGVGVRVVRHGRQGLSWTGLLDDDALSQCIDDARDNAEFGSHDEHVGLAEPDGVAVSDVDLYDPRIESVTAEQRISLAAELERILLAADDRMVGVESADYADSRSVMSIVTTTGIRRSSVESSAYLGTWALAAEDDDVTTGFGYSVGRSAELLDPGSAAAEAVERCVAAFGARKVAGGRATVILDPYVTSQFLGAVAELLSGEAAVRGRSPFARRLGEPVAAPSVTLYDDPLDPLAPTASDVDGEGLACRRVPLISGGSLEGFLHNAYTARVAGVVSTGSASRPTHRSGPGVGPRSLRLAPGDGDLSDVLGRVGEGILVREVSGMHSGVNPISGDLSVGIEGRIVRGGAPAQPVREMTIASTIPRMLLDVVDIGADLTRFPWESAGVTLAIADVTVSGT